MQERRSKGDDAIYFEHDGPCKDSTRHRRCPGRWRGEITTGRSPQGRRLRRRVSGPVQGRRAGRPQGAAEGDRRRDHQGRASELHGPAVLRGLADRRAARPGPQDGREEQVRPRAAAGGHRQYPAAGPGRHRRRQGAGRGRGDAEQRDGGDGAPGPDPSDHAGAGQEPRRCATCPR